jgi:hypothetical protein
VDFGEALASIGGVLQKIHFFVMSLVHSDAMFVMAFPRECTEAFLEAHVQAFTFFGFVPPRTLETLMGSGSSVGLVNGRIDPGLLAYRRLWIRSCNRCSSACWFWNQSVDQTR